MEKLVYLVWDRPSVAPEVLRTQWLDEVAPRLLALGPAALQIDLDDDDAQVASMVPIPGDELPGAGVRVDLARRPRPTRAVRRDARRRGHAAGRLPRDRVAVPRLRRQRARAAARLARRHRSPGIITLTVFDKPAGVDDETFYGHWYGHQSPMSEWMQPRARYVRNAVVRALTPGAPRYRAIVEEAWPQRRARHRTCTRSSARRDPTSSARRIRIMLDSTKLLYDPDTMRNYTLSEYILKTPYQLELGALASLTHASHASSAASYSRRRW